MVTGLGECFFSGISGSTVADLSAIGSLMVPALKKAGYKSDETVSICAAASARGMLVPPSIPAVVLGGITGMSVGALFVGGFIPAMVLMACIMVLIYILSVRSKIPLEKRLSFKGSMGAVVGAIIPLLCPVIIFAGILTGAATPTEIAVIAVLYAFIVGVFVYREIAWNQIIPIFLPFVVKLGINQIHFGILCIACLGIGIFLPPIGMGMFIACNFAGIDVGKMFRSFAPFLLVLLIGLFIITYVPWL